MKVEEAVGDTILVDVAGLSLKELAGLGESAIACTLRDVLDADNADVEVLSAFESKG